MLKKTIVVPALGTGWPDGGFDIVLPLVAGDILYAANGTHLTRLAKGTAGQPLVMNSGETAPRWGFINRLAGVLAIQSGWDTAPINLANCTDGDFATVSGTAITNNLAAYAEGGLFQWDMGATYSVQVRAKLSMANATAWQTMVARLYVSLDTATWYYCGGSTNWISTNGDANALTIAFTNCAFAYGRYLKVVLVNYGSQANCSLAIYEMQAIDCGL